MTREEAIVQLKMDRDLRKFINPLTGEEEPINEDCRKSVVALDIAIKALEQEPILDKIIADIGSALSEEVLDDNKQRISDIGIGLEIALSIIDKYKAESEDD